MADEHENCVSADRYNQDVEAYIQGRQKLLKERSELREMLKSADRLIALYLQEAGTSDGRAMECGEWLAKVQKVLEAK